MLIIYAGNVTNNGKIISQGSSGVAGLNRLSTAGGGSGGGSINIFYKNIYNKGTIVATGGKAGISYLNGGAGGAGCVSIGSISTGTYTEYVETTETE